MSLSPADTEQLYERLAQAIDEARALGPPEEMEALFLAKLAFAALRNSEDLAQAETLVSLCLKDIAPEQA